MSTFLDARPARVDSLSRRTRSFDLKSPRRGRNITSSNLSPPTTIALPSFGAKGINFANNVALFYRPHWQVTSNRAKQPSHQKPPITRHNALFITYTLKTLLMRNDRATARFPFDLCDNLVRTFRSDRPESIWHERIVFFSSLFFSRLFKNNVEGGESTAKKWTPWWQVLRSPRRGTSTRIVKEINARTRQQYEDIEPRLTCYSVSNLQLRIAHSVPFLREFSLAVVLSAITSVRCTIGDRRDGARRSLQRCST